MEQLVSVLLAWIGMNTGYNVDNIEPPEISLLTAQEMTAEYYRDSGVAMPDTGIDSRVLALYNYEESDNGVIFLLDPRLNDDLQPESWLLANQPEVEDGPLSDEWLGNPVFQEQLLHELVHHVQFQSGAAATFSCTAFGEKEAYLLGGEYLKRRHAADPLPNRKVLAYMYSRC